MALVLSSPASAGAIGMVISPNTAAPGTVVNITALTCSTDGTATVGGQTVTLEHVKGETSSSGSYTIPQGMTAGTYTVTVKCGDDTGSDNLVVTGGGGSEAGGGGALALAEGDPAMVGAGAAAVGAGGLLAYYALRRRKAQPEA